MPGEFTQHDFGQVEVRFIDGTEKRIHFFASRLKCYSVTAIDTKTMEILATIPFSGGLIQPIGITPDGRHAYVGGFTGIVSVIDTKTNKVVDTISSISQPRGMAITADGARIYMGGLFGDIDVIDTSPNRVVHPNCTSAFCRGHRLVVEVTPRMQAQHPEWNSAAMKTLQVHHTDSLPRQRHGGLAPIQRRPVHCGFGTARTQPRRLSHRSSLTCQHSDPPAPKSGLASTASTPTRATTQVGPWTTWSCRPCRFDRPRWSGLIASAGDILALDGAFVL